MRRQSSLGPLLSPITVPAHKLAACQRAILEQVTKAAAVAVKGTGRAELGSAVRQAVSHVQDAPRASIGTDSCGDLTHVIAFTYPAEVSKFSPCNEGCSSPLSEFVLGCT